MYDEKCLSRVGRNVRALRIAAQLGQDELARKLGVSQTHMSNLECGRVTTSIRGMLKLANIFDCSLDVLLDKKAGLKLAAERTEANVEAADDQELSEQQAESNAKAAAGKNSAECETGGVYSWEDVRQLLELLHKAQAGPQVNPARQKNTGKSAAELLQKTAAPKTAAQKAAKKLKIPKTTTTKEQTDDRNKISE